MLQNKIIYVTALSDNECLEVSYNQFVAYPLNEKDKPYETYINFEYEEFQFNSRLVLSMLQKKIIIRKSYCPSQIYKRLALIGWENDVP